MEPAYPRPENKRPATDRRLWRSLFALPAIWALHLFVTYALASLACSRSLFGFTLFGVEGIRVVLLALTLLAGAALVLAGAAPYRIWRQQRAEEDEGNEPTGRMRFMAISGVLLAAYLLLAMIWSTVTIVTSALCELG